MIAYGCRCSYHYHYYGGGWYYPVHLAGWDWLWVLIWVAVVIGGYAWIRSDW